MVKLVLQRHTTGDHGTFGTIQVGDKTLFTGELPWRDLDEDCISDSDFSCIPAGTFRCTHTFSPRFKRKLYEVHGVPGRVTIRIHPATFMGDSKKGFKCQLRGCIVVARALGYMDKQRCTLLTRLGVGDLEAYLERKPFLLEVRNA